MKAKATDVCVGYDEQGQEQLILTLTQPSSIRDIADLKEIVAKGKELAVEVKQYRPKRSLDANAYLWVLLSKIADALHTTKEEVYLAMLGRYGVFTHLVVKPHVVERVKREWRTVQELGEVTVNGKTGIQLQCYFGSSTYDSKEMATLIDGVVSECQEMGIETMPPEELQSLKEEWGK